MNPDLSDGEIERAAIQLAAWLQFELARSRSDVADAVESGMPGAIRGKDAFAIRLGGAKNLIQKTESALAARLAADPWFRRHGAPAVRHWRFEPQPPEMTARWPGLPLLHTTADLCAWLGGLCLGELEWLANIDRGRTDPACRQGHYHHRWIPRGHGSPPRLLASPKPRLKNIQRKILRQILDLVPIHEAAHGFRSGRSIRTFAMPHVGKPCVARADLADFFPSIRFGRVAAFFETAGYPDSVARVLAGLCCHAAPSALVRAAGLPRAMGDRLRRAHLPQGAPTSPALSNAIAFRLDRRLAGLADSIGAHYTRYADDLAFSGGADFRRGATRFLEWVAAIVLEEGFELNYRKLRVMPANLRQRIAGVVVNEKPNTTRSVYDELKAILHRWETRGISTCAGGEDDAFADRLRGRIAALSQLNAEKGEKLRLRFEGLRAG
jgi:RNA-directed DNA polymerase